MTTNLFRFARFGSALFTLSLVTSNVFASTFVPLAPTYAGTPTGLIGAGELNDSVLGTGLFTTSMLLVNGDTSGAPVGHFRLDFVKGTTITEFRVWPIDVLHSTLGINGNQATMTTACSRYVISNGKVTVSRGTITLIALDNRQAIATFGNPDSLSITFAPSDGTAITQVRDSITAGDIVVSNKGGRL